MNRQMTTLPELKVLPKNTHLISWFCKKNHLFLSILPNNSHIGCLSLKAKFNTSSLLSVTLGSSPKVLVLIDSINVM